MKQRLLFCLLIPFFSFSQIQIGNDINGENQYDISGYSVSLSSDGNVVAIGAPYNDNLNGVDSGHVRVYENISGVWTQIGNDIDGEAASDFSGWSVSLSSDGSIVAIGAMHSSSGSQLSGQVRVYENISGVWTQIGNDIDGEGVGDNLGYSVSLSSDGSILAAGAPYNDGNGSDSGHVRIYENISGVWTQIGNDINGEGGSDNLGWSVNLSSNGNIVAVGAIYNSNVNGPSAGHVRVYENISGVWTQIGNDIDGDEDFNLLGYSVSLSSNGNILAVGAPSKGGSNSGYGFVRVFENISNNWIQKGNDIIGESLNEWSGFSVSLSSDGNNIAVGAPYNYNSTGKARIYKYLSSSWIKVGNDINGKNWYDDFGSSVSLSSNGTILAVGSPANDFSYTQIYDLNAVLSTKSFENNYFSFYPNPVKDVLNIDLNKGIELKQVNIYTIEGRYLYSVKSKKIETKHLTSGMYVFEVETNAGKSAKKIIIE